MAGILLTDLVSQIRDRSGLRQNQLYTDTQIAQFASDRWEQLYDRFVAANQHYFVTHFDFTLTGGSTNTIGIDRAALPDDFQLGNGLELNPDTARPVSVPYLDNWLDRNNLGLTALSATIPVVADRRYCYSGSELVVLPPTSAGGTYRGYYTPMCKRLQAKSVLVIQASAGQDDTTGGGSGWNMTRGGFTADMLGGVIVPSWQAPNTAFNIPYTITQVQSSTFVHTSPAPSVTPGGSFINPDNGFITVTWQPPGTTDTLPVQAMPWSVYIKLGASIDIREARQQDCSDLAKSFQAQEERVQQILSNRQEEAEQPPLTRDRNFFDWF